MTTIAHPLTGKPHPLVLTCSAAAESVGITRAALEKLCAAGEIDHAPHEPFGRWQVYTIPLWRKFGLLGEIVTVEAGS